MVGERHLENPACASQELPTEEGAPCEEGTHLVPPVHPAVAQDSGGKGRM